MKFSNLAITAIVSLGLLYVPIIDAHEEEERTIAMGAKPNSFWWPEAVNLAPLRQHAAKSNPMGESFDYRKEFLKLDLKAAKEDIRKTLKDSQSWWPADYGHYGPFFIRMTWHSAGTYRVTDGRGGAAGGQMRLDPLNSWPDNGNLDKARRLLWPVKKKYGKRLSWADLMVLAGNVALEDMGFKTFGFAGGREDDWEPNLVYWGPEQEFKGRSRHTKSGKLKRPFGATHMGLIYVNPEGPDGVPDPLKSAAAIRESFARMAMNDEETVALIAGGHTFGKAHGAHKVEKCVGREPGGAPIEAQGFGWHNKCGKGHSEDTITSGLEGAWTPTPIKWSNQYLTLLFAFDWELTRSPAGAKQWKPTNRSTDNMVPDAHDPNKRHAPMMLTTDLALKSDPAYRKIALRFRDNMAEFEDAFARAWFKLTHRDMGPAGRYLGSDRPSESLIWQDPIPAVNHKLIDTRDITKLKHKILSSGLSVSELVRTAWAAASSFRGTDLRGGANGARIRLSPQKDWAVNDPSDLAKVLTKLENLQQNFNTQLSNGKKVSFADVVILGGAAGIEKAVRDYGYKRIKVPFTPGRMDTTAELTDVSSFNDLEPKADAFRNYYHSSAGFNPTYMLVDKAHMLQLSVPEMTALIGGMRVLDANSGKSSHGVFTDTPGVLSNDFFVNLLDMNNKWVKSASEPGIYNAIDRHSGKLRWTGTPVDLVFGSHAELRAIAEVYAADDGRRKFVRDFINAWTKVMRADRFDLN